MAPTEPQLKSRFSHFLTSTFAASMSETNKHIVPMPAWGKFTGIARFVIAILVLVFAAAATGIWGAYTGFGFTLFTASATLITFAYYFVALSHKPQYYNRWAVLALEIFGVIFWLVSFALCAEWTSVYNDGYWWNGGHTSYGFWNAPFSPKDIGLQSRGLRRRGANKYRAGVALAGTAAGLGAVEFVLFTVTLIVYSTNLHQHRLAGNPSVYGTAMKPAAPPPAPTPASAAATKGKKPEESEAKADTEDSVPQLVRKDDAAVV